MLNPLQNYDYKGNHSRFQRNFKDNFLSRNIKYKWKFKTLKTRKANIVNGSGPFKMEQKQKTPNDHLNLIAIEKNQQLFT